MTALAVILVGKQLAVASDTQTTSSDGAVSGPVSKIFAERDVFFTTSGLRRYGDAAFDADAFARAACRLGGTLKRRSEQYVNSVRQHRLDAVQHIFNTRPNDFEADLRSKVALGVVFFGFVSGRLEVAGVLFKADESNGLVNLTVQTAGEARRDFVLLDAPGDIREEFQAGMSELEVRQDPVGVARRFIEFAADKSPGQVGRLVEVIRITRDGANWIQRLPATDGS